MYICLVLSLHVCSGSALEVQVCLLMLVLVAWMDEVITHPPL